MEKKAIKSEISSVTVQGSLLAFREVESGKWQESRRKDVAVRSLMVHGQADL